MKLKYWKFEDHEGESRVRCTEAPILLYYRELNKPGCGFKRRLATRAEMKENCFFWLAQVFHEEIDPDVRAAVLGEFFMIFMEEYGYAARHSTF